MGLDEARERPAQTRGRELALLRIDDAVDALRRHGRAVAGWMIPFALVLLLAFDNGGYDIGVRSEIGIAVWWIILVGAASGMLRFRRIGREGWVAMGVMALLALWAGLAIGWSESAERSALELGRVTTYLGILVLAFALQGRDGLRRTVSALAAAIALVGLAALISRLQPGTFGEGIDTVVLGAAESRLNYPLNYWNGLAALMAVGIPLVLTMALRARWLVAQALAAAAVPALALTAFLTLSRGGAVEIALALVVLVALYPRRLAAAPTLLLCVGGSAILIAATTQRDALETGISGAAAAHQGDEMLAMALVVCGGVALLQFSIGVVRRYQLVPRVEIPRRVTWIAGALAALIGLVVAIGPGDLSGRWEEFKQPAAPTGFGAERFEGGTGSGRYQMWSAAVDASETESLGGIGPGSFEFWWAREADINAFVRDAHSLYLEKLAELGIVGFALVLALVGGTLALGVQRVLRTSEDKRALLAGAIAAAAAFAFAAAIDWVWELAVLPCAFLFLIAAIAGPKVVRRRIAARGTGRRAKLASEADPPAIRVAIGGAALAALVAIAIPYAGASAISDSTAAAREADFDTALERVDRAEAIQPYAASPHLQRALLLEIEGELGAAAKAAEEATEKESTNWRTWIVLSAIEARRGNAEAAAKAYRAARSLNPRSLLFTELR